MKATQRPIHCSDKKRLQFYIKENDKYTKSFIYVVPERNSDIKKS